MFKFLYFHKKEWTIFVYIPLFSQEGVNHLCLHSSIFTRRSQPSFLTFLYFHKKESTIFVNIPLDMFQFRTIAITRSNELFSLRNFLFTLYQQFPDYLYMYVYEDVRDANTLNASTVSVCFWYLNSVVTSISNITVLYIFLFEFCLICWKNVHAWHHVD